MDDGGYQVDVAEVAGALPGPSATGPASEARIYHPEPRVHQPHLDGEPVVVVGVCGYDLHNAHPPELLGRDEPKTDLTNSLRDGHIYT